MKRTPHTNEECEALRKIIESDPEVFYKNIRWGSFTWPYTRDHLRNCVQCRAALDTAMSSLCQGQEKVLS